MGRVRDAWSNGRIIGLLVAFGVSLCAVGAHQHWKGEAAIFPTRLLRNRTFAAFLFSGFFSASAQFVVLYYVSLFHSLRDPWPDNRS